MKQLETWSLKKMEIACLDCRRIETGAIIDTITNEPLTMGKSNFVPDAGFAKKPEIGECFFCGADTATDGNGFEAVYFVGEDGKVHEACKCCAEIKNLEETDFSGVPIRAGKIFDETTTSCLNGDVETAGWKKRKEMEAAKKKKRSAGKAECSNPLPAGWAFGSGWT